MSDSIQTPEPTPTPTTPEPTPRATPRPTRPPDSYLNDGGGGIIS